jgi:glutathione peroxidase
MRLAPLIALLLAPLTAFAGEMMPEQLQFQSIDGGQIALDDWRGHPVLIVNTASLCGYTPQYAALQALSDRLGPAGLMVLAVPSDDFRQELGTEAEVKDFCEVNFGLTLPMTVITPVLGPAAHPLYQWLAADHGYVPAWNFNKVLIGADGRLVGYWGSGVAPDAPEVILAIQGELGL